MPQDPNSDSKLTHLNADTDSSVTAIHHTLGAGPTQASPGSHRHDGTDSYQISATDIIGDIPAANGLPPGGDAGQILVKDTATDYDAIWVDNNGGAASQVKHEVKLGASIAKGQAVYVSSADGTNMIVSKASNASEATSSKTMGLLESGGSTNAKVNVVTEGLLSGLDTSTATAGDPVWLGTSGNLIYGLGSKPVAPAHLVFIGVVTRANSSNGEIFVKPQNGFELNEIHDVLIVAPATGEVIQRTASNLWENKTLAEAGIASTAHGVTHMSGGSDEIYLQQAQVLNLTTDLAGKASTTHAFTHLTGGSDEIVVDIGQVAGLTSALSGKASTTHASTHASGGSDAITIAPAQVTGTAVITTDSRLSNARTPTAHGVTHMSGGSDEIYLQQAQVLNLTTDLAGKASTTHAFTHLTGGSDEIVVDIGQVAGLTSALSGKASSTHVHGNISNTGTLATSVTATNPVKVVITNSSDTVGTLSTSGASGTTFLRGDGTWSTPVGLGYVGSFQTTAASSSSAVSLAPETVSTTPANDISITGGTTTNTAGNAGEVNITGGASTTGTGLSTGGNVIIRGGATNTSQGAGGNVTINGGQGSAANGNGDVSIGTTTTDSVTIGAPLTATGGVSSTYQTIANSGGSGVTPMIVKGASGQSANLHEWQNSGGTVTGYVRPDGNAIIFGGVEATYYMTATAGTTSNVPMTVYGRSGHTANLQEWLRLGDGSPRASVSSTGAITSAGLNLSSTTSPLTANGSAGTSGMILTSAGAGNSPTWATPGTTPVIKVAANRTTSTTGTTALTVNSGETFAITFPSGRFSVSPAVTAATSSPRYIAAVTQVTTAGFTLSVRNVSDASGTTYLYHWNAIEIVAGMGN